MCEPSTTTLFVTSLALSAASAASQYVSQASAASAEADYQNKMAEENVRYRDENAKAATAAYIEEAAQENLRLAQTEEAASGELQEISRERVDAVGTAVASSEGAGLAFDMLMADYNRQESGYRENINRQLEFEKQQSKLNIKGYQSKAQGRINSVRPYIREPIKSPSLLGVGLQFGGGALDAYDKYGSDMSKKDKPDYKYGYKSHTGRTKYSRSR